MGKYFEKIKRGLEGTNNKLKELSDEISSAKSFEEGTVETVKSAINRVSGVFKQLIVALEKLAGVSK